MKRKIHFYIFMLLFCCVALTAKGQVAEYNTGNYWIHATGTKYINMDFVNTSTGVWMNNGEVWYKGNFTNNGTVDFDNSLVVNPGLSHFEGTANQVLSGSGTTRFYNVLFSNSLISGAFSLQQGIRVAHQADFKKGIITSSQTTLETMMNMVTLENGATSVNTSDASHVDGFVSKIGNSAFTFPIGNGGYYRQASISAPANATDEFAARYIFSNPASVGSVSSKDASISQISNKEYWVVQRRNGTSNIQLTLSWDISKTSATIPSNLNKLIIVRWNGTKWVNEGNIATTGNSSIGTITSDITGYGEFTLGMLTLDPPTINSVTDSSTTVSGKGEPGATVTVTYPDGTTSTAIVQADGTWTTTIPTSIHLKGGDTITATQTDGSGNKSKPATTTVTATVLPHVFKTATTPVRNNDGTFNWVYTIRINNDINQAIDSVQVEDNLDEVFKFKDCTYKVVSITASGALKANGLYNGSSVIKTLTETEGQTMAVSAKDSIMIEVNVDPHRQSEIVSLFNQALFTGKASNRELVVKSDANMSTISLEATQTDIPVINLFIPDGFSPNGDNINDMFVITHTQSTKIDIDVFNRWGNSVYKSIDYQNNWDGKGTGSFLGHDLVSGTYFCSYRLIEISTGKVISEGVKSITLRRDY